MIKNMNNKNIVNGYRDKCLPNVSANNAFIVRIKQEQMPLPPTPPPWAPGAGTASVSHPHLNGLMAHFHHSG